MNNIHEPRERRQALSYRTREVYPTGTSPSTPSRPQRSQSSSTVAMTRSNSPRWKLNWSGPAAVWSQRARTALSACTTLPGELTSASGGVSGGVPLFTRASTLTVGGNQLDGLLEGRMQVTKAKPPQKKDPRILQVAHRGTSEPRAEWQL